MPSNPDNLTNAVDGLPAKLIGQKVHTWRSKAVIHKKLQTVRLIFRSDVAHVIPDWNHVYEVDNVIVMRQVEYDRIMSKLEN